MTADLARLSATLADRYRIERELGQGGMATVYLAEDVRHRRKVALKVLQSFPDPTLGRWKLSSNGASEPVWSRGGKEVVFRQRDTVMAVTVNPDAKEIGTPVPLFGGPYVFHAAWDEGHSYDVTKDGETFVMLREPPGRQRRRLVVTVNWLAELKSKVPR